MARHLILKVLLSGLIIEICVMDVGAQSWRATEKPPTAPPIKSQKNYDGVTPGNGNNLPRVEELRNKPGTWVTWPGFSIRQDGATQVFIQTTASVEYETVQKKRVITIQLKNATVFLNNNRNPLVTTHINTPLRRAYLKKTKKSVALVLELKQKSLFQISQNTDNDGYSYLFVYFPPGSYPIGETPSDLPTFSGYGNPAQKSEEKSPSSSNESQNVSQDEYQ